MFDPQQYQLLDFGEGRKLERFGEFLLDRPSPAAERFDRLDASLWKQAHARYVRTTGDQGVWKPKKNLPDSWQIRYGEVVFELRPTPFGHVGVFPEQAENWDWIARQVARANRPLKILNLFAYTGGSTLAAVAASLAATGESEPSSSLPSGQKDKPSSPLPSREKDKPSFSLPSRGRAGEGCSPGETRLAMEAEVVHIDAAKNTVAWARRNAEHSRLSAAKIRWIAEDARKFVRRELRRGNRYDAVILDPPSYGHGAKGESWKIARDLPRLVEQCGQLTSESRAFILLTCHAPAFGPAELEALLADAVFGSCQAGAAARPLNIRSANGRELPCGVVARWPG